MGDPVVNLTELFNAAGASHTVLEIHAFQIVCENNTQCLLAIARADTKDAGQIVMNVMHDEKRKKDYAGESSKLCILKACQVLSHNLLSMMIVSVV